MYHQRCAYEAHLRFDIFPSPLSHPRTSFAFALCGIFGQASTEAASTAQTGRWWYGWPGLNASIRCSLTMLDVMPCSTASAPTIAPSKPPSTLPRHVVLWKASRSFSKSSSVGRSVSSVTILARSWTCRRCYRCLRRRSYFCCRGHCVWEK